MNALSIVEPDPSFQPFVAALAIRMADEGIPIRAIARATRLPSDQIYSAIREAIDRGQIVDMPKDEWPVGSSRTTRTPNFPGILENEDTFQFACSRCFKLTKQEANVFGALLKRVEVTREQVHSAIESGRPGEHREPTEPKIIDVVICKLRKKMALHDIHINTSWGKGYYIEGKQRERAVGMMNGYVLHDIAASKDVA